VNWRQITNFLRAEQLPVGVSKNQKLIVPANLANDHINCRLCGCTIDTLDFAVKRFLMKLFKTYNIDVIQDCCNFLKFSLPSDLLAVRYVTFFNRYRLCKKLHWYFGLK